MDSNNLSENYKNVDVDRLDDDAIDFAISNNLIRFEQLSVEQSIRHLSRIHTKREELAAEEEKDGLDEFNRASDQVNYLVKSMLFANATALIFLANSIGGSTVKHIDMNYAINSMFCFVVGLFSAAFTMMLRVSLQQMVYYETNRRVFRFRTENNIKRIRIPRANRKASRIEKLLDWQLEHQMANKHVTLYAGLVMMLAMMVSFILGIYFSIRGLTISIT